MCHNIDWFDTHKSYNDSNVLMENNAPCKDNRTSTIKIKMYDGIVRTLGDVRHVPVLKKNSIFPSALKSNGCTFTGG